MMLLLDKRLPLSLSSPDARLMYLVSAILHSLTLLPHSLSSLAAAAPRLSSTITLDSLFFA